MKSCCSVDMVFEFCKIKSSGDGNSGNVLSATELHT